ncbi:MAG TPA: hypothetical protein VF172_07340 [Nitrososphaera sp.]|jgi:hypothetical protein
MGPRDGQQAASVLYPEWLMHDWKERKASVIIFLCDNTEKTFAELASKGVNFKQEPKRYSKILTVTNSSSQRLGNKKGRRR